MTRVQEEGAGNVVRGYELLGDALATVSSGHVFGLMGDGNMAALSYMDANKLGSYHGARHEAGSVSMAAGYARATRGLGVCTVTHGPGFTNALTALQAAVQDRTPLLLVVGELPAQAVHHAQLVDHQALARVVGAECVYARRADEIERKVVHAAATAAAERRPIVLRVAHEAMWGEAEALPPAALDGARVEVGPAVAPATALDRMVTLLAGAQSPVILVGRGVVLSDSEELVGELAERTGALIVTTLGAKGACHGHRRTIGLVGGFAHPVVADLVRDSDLVLALGASLNGFTTVEGTLIGPATLVQVDASAEAIGRMVPVHLGVVGDVRGTVLSVLERLPEDAGSNSRDVDAMSAQLARCHRWEVVDDSDELGLDPRVLAKAVDAAFPARRSVVLDGGHLIEWGSRYVSATDAASWHMSLGAGAIGLSTSLALGVAIGTAAPTLVIVGDGSCLMSINDLDVAVRERAPLCVLVVNDRAYGAEVYKLRQYGLDERLASFETPSFAAIAEAMGAQAVRLRTTDDLDRLRSLDWTAVLAEGPLVIDAEVTTNVVSERLRTPA